MDLPMPKKPDEIRLFKVPIDKAPSKIVETVLETNGDIDDIVLIVNFTQFVRWVSKLTLHGAKEDQPEDDWWEKGERPPWESE